MCRDIKDLMIDLSSGRVAYAVVEFDTLFGVASKPLAVPMRALRQDAENRCFVMDAATKDALDQASGRTDPAGGTLQDSVHKQHNAPPYWV